MLSCAPVSRLLPLLTPAAAAASSRSVLLSHGRMTVAVLVSPTSSRAASSAASPAVTVNTTPFEAKTLAQVQVEATKRYANNPLFGTIEPDGRKVTWQTYKEFDELVTKFCCKLHALGIAKGDRVAMISNNRPEWAATAYAAFRLGAQIVPMYENQTPSDWEHIVRDSDAKLLLTSNSKLHDAAQFLKGKLPELKNIMTFEYLKQLPLDVCKPMMVEISPHDVATVIYTSGTTGKPKGVMQSHDNIISNIRGLHSTVPPHIHSGEARHLSFLPWAHSYGQTCELHNALTRGCSLGLSRSNQTILDDLGHIKPSVLIAVPELFKRIYDGVMKKVATLSPTKKKLFEWGLGVGKERAAIIDAGGDPAKYPILSLKWAFADRVVLSNIKSKLGGELRFSNTGGASLAKEIKEFFTNLGIPVLEGYGLTETSPVVAAEGMYNRERINKGMKALPGVEILIRDLDSDAILPVGKEGEVCVSGPNVMLGYNKNEEETKKVIVTINGKRVFKTGDMGKLDAAGNLVLTGRVKEQYKLSNGKFVVPARVEDAIKLSPYVAFVMLYGLNRPHNVALIYPNYENVGEKLGMAGAKPEEILRQKKDEVMRLLLKDVELLSLKAPDFKMYEAVKKIVLMPYPLSIENGTLTNKLSVKRHEVTKVFAKEIEEAYASPN